MDLSKGRGSTGSDCIENWLWKGRWTCRKEEGALDRTVWRTGFGRDDGPVERKREHWIGLYRELALEGTVDLSKGRLRKKIKE
jgi:hypothetical protein